MKKTVHIRMMKSITAKLFGLAIILGSATPTLADTIILDFGSVSEPNFGVVGGVNIIQYNNVGVGVNASLSVDSIFDALTPANHGSVTGNHVGAEGDVRVNMTASIGNTDPNNIDNGGVFTLQLWDANAGDGFSVGYSSGTSYEWDLNFYDIDAGTPNPNGFFTYDHLRVLSPSTYTLAATSQIGVTENADGSVSFSGISAGAVPGQAGLGLPFTQAQSDASVQINLVDSNSLTFEYAALRNGGNNLGSNGRNLLIDGGEISGVFDGLTTLSGTIAAVPEPSSHLLLFSSLLAWLCVRKRKQS